MQSSFLIFLCLFFCIASADIAYNCTVCEVIAARVYQYNSPWPSRRSYSEIRSFINNICTTVPWLTLPPQNAECNLLVSNLGESIANLSLLQTTTFNVCQALIPFCWPLATQSNTYGGCCLSTICLDNITDVGCSLSEGTFYGNRTACSAFNCTSACCLPGGTCALYTPSGCTAAGGTPLGVGTACSGSGKCGACCTTGSCSVANSLTCSGTYFGDLTTCSSASCRACCSAGDVCTDVRSVLDCVGTVSPDGSYCTSSSSCGACCASNYSCYSHIASQACVTYMGGTYQGNAATCASGTCGACCTAVGCFPTGGSSLCTGGGGGYQGDGVTCVSAPCGTCWYSPSTSKPYLCGQMACKYSSFANCAPNGVGWVATGSGNQPCTGPCGGTYLQHVCGWFDTTHSCCNDHSNPRCCQFRAVGSFGGTCPNAFTTDYLVNSAPYDCSAINTIGSCRHNDGSCHAAEGLYSCFNEAPESAWNGGGTCIATCSN